MLELYQIIGKSFFNVLASKNRETYLQCLFLLFDELDNLYQEGDNTKQSVTSIIEDFLDSKLDTTIYDEDESEMILKGNREKASYILNLFIRQKWLFEEDLGNYDVAINFYDHSVKVLRTLREINDNDQTEYTGLISSIYFSLKNFSTNDIGQFEQIYRRTDELIGNLKTLRSNIYLYYNNMIKNKSRENLEELFTQLIEYKRNFFDRAFYNLQTKDTLKKYKYDILSILNEIRNNEQTIGELSNLLIDDKYTTFEDAQNFVLSKLHDVQHSFESIDRLNQTIVIRSEQYLNALISKIQFILNRSEDVEGLFNQLYDYIINDDLKEYKFVNLVDSRVLNKDSLFTPRNISEKIENSVLGVDFLEVDDITKDKTIQTLMQNKKYSLEEINRYIDGMIGNDLSVNASNLPLVNYDDYIYLMLIYLYSRNPETIYRVRILEDKVNINNIRFRDFEIVRRKK